MESRTSKEIIDDIMSKYNEIVLLDALRLLKVLFKNILKNEGEEKFKNLKLSNPVLKSKVLIIPEAINLFEVTGYVKEAEDLYVFKGDRETLKETKKYIKRKIKVLKAAAKKYEEEKRAKEEEIERLRRLNVELQRKNEELERERVKKLKEEERKEQEERENHHEEERRHTPPGYHWSPAPSCYSRDFGTEWMLVKDSPERGYRRDSSNSSAEERMRNAYYH